VIGLRKYEREFVRGIEFKDIDRNKLVENLNTKKFNLIDKTDLDNGLVFILEKFSLVLGCKSLSTIIIYEHNTLIKVRIITVCGKLELFNMSTIKTIHNDVVNVVMEVLNTKSNEFKFFDR
jgi:hypothetical protein